VISVFLAVRNLLFITFQACKMKLGLLEEEDDSKLLEDSNKNTNDIGNAIVAT